MSVKLLTFVLLLISSLNFAQNDYGFVTGFVLNSQTKEPVENCNITLPYLRTGTATDTHGYFKFKLPAGHYTLKFSFVGFKTMERTVTVTHNTKTELKVLLTPEIIKENEIKITAKKEAPSTIIQKIPSKDLRFMPTINSDVLRSVQILSGVSTNNELTSGYNVRGGSFDENLIYLNGYEIYRPFLLRTGIEENQSLINPEMVENLTFYNGTFPASLGDKMSSALEITYKNNNEKNLHGSIQADFFNLGANINNKYKNLNWNFGIRYAYPSTFLNTLQTKGDYKPFFSDIQILADYEISQTSSLELLGIYANNKFEFIPKTWNGNFNGFHRGDQRGLSIDFLGNKNLSYITNLTGIKYKNKINNNFIFTTSVSKYFTEETEKYNTENIIYYNSNPFNPSYNREYIKTQLEKGNNHVRLNSYRFKTKLSFTHKIHGINIGMEYRLSKFESVLNEKFNEYGKNILIEKEKKKHYNLHYNLNSFSFFAEDNITFGNKFNANIGFRFLNYKLTGEHLFSPRVTFSYRPILRHNFTVSWGYYYQPPFINELRGTEANSLISQKAIHYVLGWEYLIKHNLKLKAEIYYKDLHNLIPFYFDEFKMIYVEGNNREGFAKGIDIMLEGNFVDGMKSWFGYSYLDTRERKTGSKKYIRRLFDQTHTLQIFLQDKMGKHKNIQSHLRFLAGSGFLYYNRYLKRNPETNNTYIGIDFNNPFEYLFYLRVDMGLSAAFKLNNNFKLIGIVEILNVFNRYNAGAYQWVQALKEINAPVNIPQILSKRFLNIKIKLLF